MTETQKCSCELYDGLTLILVVVVVVVVVFCFLVEFPSSEIS